MIKSYIHITSCESECYSHNFCSYEIVNEFDFMVMKHIGGDETLMHELRLTGLTTIEAWPARLFTKECYTMYWYRELPELIPSENDIKEIGKIYHKLIKLGITVGKCTFVRNDRGKILIQLPQIVSIYRNKNKTKYPRYDYTHSDYVQKSLPYGLNSWEVLYFSFVFEEIEEKLENNIALGILSRMRGKGSY